MFAGGQPIRHNQPRMPEQRRYRFPASWRVKGRGSFSPAFEARVRESRGPLTLYGVANKRNHSRLGISIGRKAGSAVKRNRIKRMLREAFRLQQHDLPAGFDFIIVVRAHEPMSLERYQQVLLELAKRIEKAWNAQPKRPTDR